MLGPTRGDRCNSILRRLHIVGMRACTFFGSVVFKLVALVVSFRFLFELVRVCIQMNFSDLVCNDQNVKL